MVASNGCRKEKLTALISFLPLLFLPSRFERTSANDLDHAVIAHFALTSNFFGMLYAACPLVSKYLGQRTFCGTQSERLPRKN